MEPESSSGRGSSKKVSRVPTTISREEDKEEKEKEDIVVPDTLLLSISPDLVTPLSFLSI